MRTCLLRILTTHDQSPTEASAYSVGLSLVSVLSFGRFVNLVSQLSGHYLSISFYPTIIIIGLAAPGRGVFTLFRDKDHSHLHRLRFFPDFSPPNLFAVLLPFLAELQTIRGLEEPS